MKIENAPNNNNLLKGLYMKKRSDIGIDSCLYFDIFPEEECDRLFALIKQEANFEIQKRFDTTIPRLQCNQAIIENNTIPIYRFVIYIYIYIFCLYKVCFCFWIRIFFSNCLTL